MGPGEDSPNRETGLRMISAVKHAGAAAAAAAATPATAYPAAPPAAAVAAPGAAPQGAPTTPPSPSPSPPADTVCTATLTRATPPPAQPPAPRVIKFKTTVPPGSLVHKALARREGWVETSDASDADLLWLDRDVAYEVLDTLHLHGKQRINHFRNDRELCRKDLLIKNLKRRKRQLEKEGLLSADAASSYDFWPTTFVLPADYDLFVLAFKAAPEATWIAKPISGSQGRGIFIFTRLSQISRWRNDSSGSVGARREEGSSTASVETYVVQSYINNPYLIAGRKFDMRLYALVTSFQPLTAYIYRGGFCRFTALRYAAAAAAPTDMERHLTNVAIQKKADAYDKAFGGKWGVRSLKLHLMTALGAAATEALFLRVERLMLHSLQAVREAMISDRRCFELYGYDVLVDADMRPWLLEVNASPSLSANTSSDAAFKAQLLRSTLDIIDLEGRSAPAQVAPRAGGFELVCVGGDVAQPRHGCAFQSIIGTDMTYAACDRYDPTHSFA